MVPLSAYLLKAAEPHWSSQDFFPCNDSYTDLIIRLIASFRTEQCLFVQHSLLGKLFNSVSQIHVDDDVNFTLKLPLPLTWIRQLHHESTSDWSSILIWHHQTQYEFNSRKSKREISIVICFNIYLIFHTNLNRNRMRLHFSKPAFSHYSICSLGVV